MQNIQETEATKGPQAVPGRLKSSFRDQLKVVVVGHVDHGKSSLIGRLFYETDSLPEGKFEQIQEQCQKRGMPFEWSFLMDALQAERDQGITIDTTRIWLKTPGRDFVFIDAPGHIEFLKNMISGSADADGAIIIIDAHEGLQEQSFRHGHLLSLMGIKQVIVAVNKMDLVDFSQERFEKIQKDYDRYLKKLGIQTTYFHPLSAKIGEGITNISDKLSWYQDVSLKDRLDGLESPLTPEKKDFRLSVQDVYKFDERRIIAGNIESGSLKVGEKIKVSPLNQEVTIKSFETLKNSFKDQGSTGEAIGVTFDKQIFVERGHILTKKTENPPLASQRLTTKVFWLGEKPLKEGDKLQLKISTSEYQVECEKIISVYSNETLVKETQRPLSKNEIGVVVFKSRTPIIFDLPHKHPQMGRFVLNLEFRPVGGGLIQDFEDLNSNIHPPEASISRAMREKASGHQAGVLWLTGPSGAGKTTLAKMLERKLFQDGKQVFLLDGDRLRNGLNQDLEFSEEDRNENIRRTAHLANLFSDAGFIVIVALISPLEKQRVLAKTQVDGPFKEIYIQSPISVCEARDVKGLYKKARSGEIGDFTGIQSPYEGPLNPDLILKTHQESEDESFKRLYQFTKFHFLSEKSQNRNNLNDFFGANI